MTIARRGLDYRSFQNDSINTYQSPLSRPESGRLDKDCLYCQADHPFTLVIPGLDGRLCECGNWIADCPGCRQWRSGLLAIGICVDCKLARDLAKAERKRRKRRGGKTTTKAATKGSALATVGGGVNV